MAETIFQKPLDAQLSSLSDAITKLYEKANGTLTKGTHVNTMSNTYCRRKGKMCTICAHLVLSAAVAGIGETVMTIEDGYRPDQQIPLVAFGIYNGSFGNIGLTINTDGTVKTLQGSQTITSYISIPCVTYPLPD